jgi:hypothetical protein
MWIIKNNGGYMKNSKIILTVAIALLAVLCAGSAFAGDQCPFANGKTEVTWKVDSITPATPEAITTCNDAQPNDCSLYGVITRINTLLKVQCTADEIKNSTLTLNLSGMPQGVTLTGPLTITLPSIVTPAQPQPIMIKKIIIDGHLPGGGKTAIFGAEAENIFEIKCEIPGMNNCAGVSNYTALEFKNLSLGNGNNAIEISANKANGGKVKMFGLDLQNVQRGVQLQGFGSLTAELSTTSISTKETGISFQNVAGLTGSITNSEIRLAGSSIVTGISFLNSSAQTFSVTSTKIDGVRNGIVIYKGGPYTSFTIDQSFISIKSVGVEITDTIGDSINITNSTFTRVGTATESSAIKLYNKQKPENLLSKVLINKDQINNFGTGVNIIGNVKDVTISNSKIDIADVGVKADSITYAFPALPASPHDIKFEKTTFTNIAKTPVQYLNLNQVTADYSDKKINSALTNSALDTPPFAGSPLKLIRDWQKPGWLRVVVPEYFLGCTNTELFWTKPNGNQLSYYPLASDEGGSTPDGKYTLDTMLDSAHSAAYSGEDLNQLGIAVAMTCQLEGGGSATSMLSAPASMAGADWLGTQELVVDTTLDDANLNACTDTPDDCSLRGAIAYVKAKRDAGKDHHFKITFLDSIKNITLLSTLNINTSLVTIVGVDKKPFIVLSDKSQDSFLLFLTKDKITLSQLVLTARSPANIASVAGADSVFDNVKFIDAQSAIMTKQPVHIKTSGNFIIDKISGPAVNLAQGGSVYVHSLFAMGSIPSTIVQNINHFPYMKPVVIKAVDFDPLTMKGTIYFKIPKAFIAAGVDAYVGYSNSTNNYKLSPIKASDFIPANVGDAENTGYKATFTVTGDVGLTWGQMKLYIIGQSLNADGSYKSTTLSDGIVIINDLAKLDSDGDGKIDQMDNCPTVANPDQLDTDKDGIGDACDDDIDGDGVPNAVDNCPLVANADQLDTDNDGIGNACDDDIDNDGIPNTADKCPFNYEPDQEKLTAECLVDSDKDSVPDNLDNCPGISNKDQIDTDGDLKGNACDEDIDGDGIPNDQDNAPGVPNPDQADTDKDNIPDVVDTDMDNDGVPNSADNCPNVANPDQVDADNNGVGDTCQHGHPGGATPGVTEPPAEGGGGCSLIR